MSGSVSRHARLVWLAGAMVAALGVASNDDRAEAYLLLDGGALDYIVPASEAIRWSADVWGPGQTLVWEIEDGPDWELLPGGAQGFVPVVEEALAVWSTIETADISWRLAGVVEASATRPALPDGRSRVSFEATNHHPLWGAELWWRRNRTADAWEITECNVGLPFNLPEGFLDPGFTEDELRQQTISFLLKEMGRCLGLRSGALPPAWSGIWGGPRPVMHWGYQPYFGRPDRCLAAAPAGGVATPDREPRGTTGGRRPSRELCPCPGAPRGGGPVARPGRRVRERGGGVPDRRAAAWRVRALGAPGAFADTPPIVDGGCDDRREGRGPASTDTRGRWPGQP